MDPDKEPLRYLQLSCWSLAKAFSKTCSSFAHEDEIVSLFDLVKLAAENPSVAQAFDSAVLSLNSNGKLSRVVSDISSICDAGPDSIPWQEAVVSGNRLGQGLPKGVFEVLLQSWKVSGDWNATLFPSTTFANLLDAAKVRILKDLLDSQVKSRGKKKRMRTELSKSIARPFSSACYFYVAGVNDGREFGLTTTMLSLQRLAAFRLKGL